MQYDWIDFYTEFATKLLPFKNDRKTLIKKINAVYAVARLNVPKLESGDEIIDIEELAFYLVGFLRENYAQNLIDRYKLSAADIELESWDIVEAIGRKRGAVISGSEIDMHRASALILDDFRSARLGRITLELP